MNKPIKLSCRFASAALVLTLAYAAELRAQEQEPAAPTENAAPSEADQQPPRPKKKKQPKPKRTGGGGFTHVLDGIAEDIENTEPEPEESPAKKNQDAGASPSSAVATSIDPKTGIATTVIRRDDGSRVVSKADRDGNVIATDLIPPPGEGPSIASTTDPATGITTSVATNPDGSKTITKTQTRQDADGTKHITTTDDQGNRTETVVSPDGTMTVKQTPDGGDTVTTTKAPDGTISVVNDHLGGGKTVTRSDSDGKIVAEEWDRQGNKLATVTKMPDGSEMREDLKGNVTKTSVPNADGVVTETTTDRRGNVTTVTRDAAGEVVARDEKRVTPKEPGQQYYEDVLKGDDWDSLPGSFKTRYAGSEEEVRATEGMQQLRAAQAEQRKREDEEIRKGQEERKARTDAKLADIQAEQKAADRKSAARIAAEEREEAERIAREERQRQLEESYETAAKLQREYDAAVARGDMLEARRIMKKQDAHSDASHSLLTLNDEEKKAMESQQAFRDQIAAKIFSSAREEAQRKFDQTVEKVVDGKKVKVQVDEDNWQGVKEDITAKTKYFSMGSDLQQITKGTTRQANHQAAEAELIRSALKKQLTDPNLSAGQRKTINDMLALADAKAAGAYEQLASNSQITAVGYAFDVATLIGAPAKGVIAGGKLLAGLGKGAVAVGKQLVGREAAQALGARATLAATNARAAATGIANSGAVKGAGNLLKSAADRASAAGTRITDSAIGEFLTTDLATGAPGKSKWLKGVVEDSIVGAGVGAGVQVYQTGTIDPEELAKGAIASAIFGRSVASVARAARPMTASDTAAGLPPNKVAPVEGGATGTRLATAPAAKEGPAVRTQTDTAPRQQPVAQPKNQPAIAKDNQSAQPPSRAKAPVVDEAKALAKTEPRSSQKPPADPNPSRRIEPPDRAPSNGEPPSDPYDAAAWKEYYAKNPNAPRSVGAAAHNDPALSSGKGKDAPPRPFEDRYAGPDEKTDIVPIEADQVPFKRPPTQEGPAGAQPIKADAPKPRIVYPPGHEPVPKPEVPNAANADRRTSVPRGDDASASKNPPESAPLMADQPRRSDPDASARLNPPEKAPGPTGATPERIRNSLGADPKAQAAFDKSMAVVKDLMKADARFAGVDINQVADAVAMRAGRLSPQANAALALSYHGPEGVRVTPKALADVTGLPKADAEKLVRAGWDDVNIKPRDIHDPGPTSLEPEHFNPNEPVSDSSQGSKGVAGPSKKPASMEPEHFDPNEPSTTDSNPGNQGAAVPDNKSRIAKDAEEYARRYPKGGVADAARVAHEAPIVEAEKLGKFIDSPDLTATGASRVRRPNVHKLRPGDADYLNDLMADVKLPNGKPVKPSQSAISAKDANDFALKILNGKPGEFPLSVDYPTQKIEIYPDGTIGKGGHHRLVGAAIASRLTGRPIFGGRNPIVPENAIEYVPQGDRNPLSNWKLDVVRPLEEKVPKARIADMRRQAEDLRRQAKSAGSPEDAARLSRQAAQLDWEAKWWSGAPD